MGRFCFLFPKSFRRALSVPLFAVAVFCCMALMSAAAFAGISSKRAGIDSTPAASAAAPVAVNPSGEADVGTMAPATDAKKDDAGVAKGARAGNEACTTANLGQIRYNPTNGYAEICD